MREPGREPAWLPALAQVRLSVLALPWARRITEDVGLLGEALSQAQGEVIISGERNLLSVSDFTHDMGQLRRAFDLFEQKTTLVTLLDTSSRATGVQIFIGGESQLVPLEEMSVVTAPYESNGRIVGTLGVIGPTRMAYERVIPIVDITARLLSNALSHS